MADIAARALRNDTRGVLQRVEQGELVTITVNGRAVAIIRPLPRRSPWMTRAEFISQVLAHPADARLTDELATLAPDTTDDLPL